MYVFHHCCVQWAIMQFNIWLKSSFWVKCQCHYITDVFSQQSYKSSYYSFEDHPIPHPFILVVHQFNHSWNERQHHEWQSFKWGESMIEYVWCIRGAHECQKVNVEKHNEVNMNQIKFLLTKTKPDKEPKSKVPVGRRERTK